jgi:hypothetical protein
MPGPTEGVAVNVRGSRTRHLLAALAVVAAVVLGATACSSDSGSGDEDTSSASTLAPRTDSGTTEADLKVAAAASTTASISGDVDSYNYLSESCRSKFTSSAWATNAEQISTGIANVIPGFDEAKVGVVSVRNVTPVDAEVQVTLVSTDGKDVIGADDAAWDKWIVENGQWVTASCAEAKDLLAGG